MEEFIHPAEEAATPDENISAEERQKRKNERLLEACVANDCGRAFQALDDGAEASGEDPDALPNEKNSLAHLAFQQTPNEHFHHYTPLHWAAYKGHLNIVWLLLKNGLSPHATDILGNTVLHQAVAGGSLPVVKTILSCGVEVHAVNKRGHTALEVASDEDVKIILRAAVSAVRCSATGEYFSHSVPRYMCSFTENFYSQSAVKLLWLYDTPDAEEKGKPVTWCEQICQAVSAAEKHLSDALQTDSLGKLDRALQSAAGLPVCPKLHQQINKKKLKLEGELALRRATNLPEMVNEEDYFHAMNALEAALAMAEDRDISEVYRKKAEGQLQRLEIELSLTTLIKKPTYENFTPNIAFEAALAEAITTAKELRVTSPVLSHAIKTKERIECHLKLKARAEATEEVSNIQDFFELKGERKALLPDWAKDSARLQEVVLALREEIANAKTAGVDEELITVAEGGRLKPLETLLIEMKRRDEERLMKKSRKKSVKKKPQKQ